MGRVRNEFDPAILEQLSVEAAGLNLHTGHLTLMKWCGRAFPQGLKPRRGTAASGRHAWRCFRMRNHGRHNEGHRPDVGVSLITVSKVTRNQTDVSERTRKRVLERAKELNYTPNVAARTLVTGRSYLVGLVVPDLLHTFFAEIAKSLSEALLKRGYCASHLHFRRESRTGRGDPEAPSRPQARRRFLLEESVNPLASN